MHTWPSSLLLLVQVCMFSMLIVLPYGLPALKMCCPIICSWIGWWNDLRCGMSFFLSLSLVLHMCIMYECPWSCVMPADGFLFSDADESWHMLLFLKCVVPSWIGWWNDLSFFKPVTGATYIMYECLWSCVLPADGFLSFALVMLMRVDMLLFWIISVRLIFLPLFLTWCLVLCFGFEPTVLVVVFEPTNCYCFVSSKLHTHNILTRFLIAGMVLSC